MMQDLTTLPTREQLITMLNLQQQINAIVDPTWLDSHYPYMRAVVVEGVEAMEHHGWKWWKKQTTDMNQLQMELVDIWHFAMSQALLDVYDTYDEEEHPDPSRISDKGVQLLADRALETLSHRDETRCETDIVSMLECLVGDATRGEFDLELYDNLLRACGIEWFVLFKLYVHKNILNVFRQQHGDKQGTYVKVWNGKEDNVWLRSIGEDMDTMAPTFYDELYQKLEETYQREHVNRVSE